MRVLIASLLAVAGAFAQTYLDTARITPALVGAFRASPVETILRCEVTPSQPMLDYRFRFQTGYSVNVPMEQYLGPNHAWLIAARVTPQDGKPSYLMTRISLPDVPPNNVKVDTFGGFVVGAGRYHIDLAMYDDLDRVCRKEWNIDAKLSHSERNIKPDIAPSAVGDFSGRGLPPDTHGHDDAPPFRLTILLHAAPASPRRTMLRINDRNLLLSTLASLADRVPALAVRLEVFNLDKQQVIYSSDDFKLDALGRVSHSLNDMQLDAIDYHTLQKPTGHVDLLSDLINREVAAANPPDAVVFLGPASRFADPFPATAVDTTASKIRFFYFQYRSFGFGRFGSGGRGGPTPMEPDSITHAVDRIKGRVIHISSPADFANAITQLERAVATVHPSAPN